MSVWISESVVLIKDIGSFLTQEPIIYIVGCFLVIPVIKVFKGLVS